ncbi:hypothetical protein LJC42_01775 [Eubacteriales bacterium OttesenSCG-928-K08]|nr:hypothetical protein [Eubacteriales bacterium OttesenSCG-928-K08]
MSAKTKICKAKKYVIAIGVCMLAGILAACQGSQTAGADPDPIPESTPTPIYTPAPIYNELISVEWNGITLDVPDTCVIEKSDGMFTAMLDADGQVFWIAISSMDTYITREHIASSEEYAKLFQTLITEQALEVTVDAAGFTEVSNMTVPYVSFTGTMNAIEGTMFFEAQITTNACTFINGQKQYIFVEMHHSQNSHGFQSLTKSVIDSITVLLDEVSRN